MLTVYDVKFIAQGEPKLLWPLLISIPVAFIPANKIHLMASQFQVRTVLFDGKFSSAIMTSTYRNNLNKSLIIQINRKQNSTLPTNLVFLNWLENDI